MRIWWGYGLVGRSRCERDWQGRDWERLDTRKPLVQHDNAGLLITFSGGATDNSRNVFPAARFISRVPASGNCKESVLMLRPNCWRDKSAKGISAKRISLLVAVLCLPSDYKRHNKPE